MPDALILRSHARINARGIAIPNPVEGYLQPLDLLYNAVYKLQFKLQIEDFLLDCHFNNEKLRVTDEKGAYVATEIYNNMSQGIIQAHGS